MDLWNRNVKVSYETMENKFESKFWILKDKFESNKDVKLKWTNVKVNRK